LSTFRESWAPKRYSEYFSLISAIGVFSIVVLGLWGAPLVKLFRPDSSYQGIGVFIPLLLSGTVLYYLGASFAYGPTISKKTYWYLFNFIISALTNIFLCYLLIPKWGILGAALALNISNLILAILSQIISNRLYYIPNKWILSFSLIVFVTICVSKLQSHNFMYNIDRYPFMIRLGATVILLLVGISPFYQDIKNGVLIKKLSEILT